MRSLRQEPSALPQQIRRLVLGLQESRQRIAPAVTQRDISVEQELHGADTRDL